MFYTQAQEFDQQRICKKVKVADRDQPLKRAVMEQKFRQEKLETPLDSSNKGVLDQVSEVPKI